MSIVDELLCAGNSFGAEGDPIDNRSKRTSVPFSEGWLASKNAKLNVRDNMNMLNWTIHHKGDKMILHYST